MERGHLLSNNEWKLKSKTVATESRLSWQSNVAVADIDAGWWRWCWRWWGTRHSWRGRPPLSDLSPDWEYPPEHKILSNEDNYFFASFWHIFAFNKHSFLLSFGTLLLLLFNTISSHLVNFVTFLVTSKVRTVTHRFSLAASDARFSSKSLLWLWSLIIAHTGYFFTGPPPSSTTMTLWSKYTPLLSTITW